MDAGYLTTLLGDDHAEHQIGVTTGDFPGLLRRTDEGVVMEQRPTILRCVDCDVRLIEGEDYAVKEVPWISSS